MVVVVPKSGAEAKKLTKVTIQREDYLQRFVYDHLQSLSLQEIKEDIQLLTLCREFPTATGPIDGVAIDQDGDVYLVEVKLDKNGDKRRALAQVMDYGASLWRTYSDPDAFVRDLKSHVSRSSGADLNDRIGNFFELEPEGVTQLLEQTRICIREGSFRFVLLMDRMDERFKDLIAFINQNSRFSVYGIELEFWDDEEQDQHVLVPRLHGAEVKKEVGDSPRRATRKWDEESFFSRLEESDLGQEAVRVLRNLYDWSDRNADEIKWGTGNDGSFNPMFHHVNPTRALFGVFTNGVLEIAFDRFANTDAGAEVAKKLAHALRSRDWPINEDAKVPRLPFGSWSSRWKEFTEVVLDVVEAE